jgi:hypothetical protein
VAAGPEPLRNRGRLASYRAGEEQHVNWPAIEPQSVVEKRTAHRHVHRLVDPATDDTSGRGCNRDAPDWSRTPLASAPGERDGGRSGAGHPGDHAAIPTPLLRKSNLGTCGRKSSCCRPDIEPRPTGEDRGGDQKSDHKRDFGPPRIRRQDGSNPDVLAATLDGPLATELQRFAASLRRDTA